MLSSILPKTNEKIRLYYYNTSGRIVFIRFFFLEELKTPKRHFEINWPLQEDTMSIWKVSSMVFQSAHYKRQEDDDLENNSMSEAAAAASIIKTPATTIHLPSETPQVRIKKNTISFFNFSCMFLNPNNFFQFIRSEKPPGTS